MELNYFIDIRNQITQKQLSEFIKKIDERLIDPIHSRSYFISYDTLAQKFLSSGKLIYCKDESGRLVGLAVMYADRHLFDFGFETFLGVLTEFTRNGIAKTLMRKEINMAKNLGMRGLMTNCSRSNIAKITLNLKMGFNEVKDSEMIASFIRINSKWDKKSFFLIEF